MGGKDGVKEKTTETVPVHAIYPVVMDSWGEGWGRGGGKSEGSGLVRRDGEIEAVQGLNGMIGKGGFGSGSSKRSLHQFRGGPAWFSDAGWSGRENVTKETTEPMCRKLLPLPFRQSSLRCCLPRRL
jgi:hypothetical protein